MRFRIEVDEAIEDHEIVLRCSCIDEQVQQLQKLISDVLARNLKLAVFRNQTEYFLAVSEILFFETEGASVGVHTQKGHYETKYRLYELERMLPAEFLRISKSTIVNTKHIYSISRNLTGASAVEFRDTPKKVYVSRQYYKLLREKMLWKSEE